MSKVGTATEKNADRRCRVPSALVSTQGAEGSLSNGNGGGWDPLLAAALSTVPFVKEGGAVAGGGQWEEDRAETTGEVAMWEVAKRQ